MKRRGFLGLVAAAFSGGLLKAKPVQQPYTLLGLPMVVVPPDESTPTGDVNGNLMAYKYTSQRVRIPMELLGDCRHDWAKQILHEEHQREIQRTMSYHKCNTCEGSGQEVAKWWEGRPLWNWVHCEDLIGGAMCSECGGTGRDPGSFTIPETIENPIEVLKLDPESSK